MQRDITLRFRPLTIWPAEFEAPENRPSPFDTSHSRALGELRRELRMLKAERGYIEAFFTPGQLRLSDGFPKATARAPEHPGIILSFDSIHGPLRYGTAVFRNWQDNLLAITRGLEALRKVDRYGISKTGQQYRGYAQLTAGPAGTFEQPLQRGREIIERHDGDRTRALRATHPDTRTLGGYTDDDFRAVMSVPE